MQFIQDFFYIRFSIVSAKEAKFECKTLIEFAEFASYKRNYYLSPLFLFKRISIRISTLNLL